MRDLTPEVILNDPNASAWLKKAVADLLVMDPLRAANEAEALAQAMRSNCNDLLSRERNRA